MKDSRTSDSTNRDTPPLPHRPVPEPLPDQQTAHGWAAWFGRSSQVDERRAVRLEAQRSCGMGGV